MTRSPNVSKKIGDILRESCAAAQTKPSSVAVGETGLFKFHPTWLSFHEGLGFSRHMVFKWYDCTAGLALSIVQSLGYGNAGSHPGLVGGGPEGLLRGNCGKPSNGWSGYPLSAQYCRNAPK